MTAADSVRLGPLLGRLGVGGALLDDRLAPSRRRPRPSDVHRRDPLAPQSWSGAGDADPEARDVTRPARDRCAGRRPRRRGPPARGRASSRGSSRVPPSSRISAAAPGTHARTRGVLVARERVEHDGRPAAVLGAATPPPLERVAPSSGPPRSRRRSRSDRSSRQHAFEPRKHPPRPAPFRQRGPNGLLKLLLVGCSLEQHLLEHGQVLVRVHLLGQARDRRDELVALDAPAARRRRARRSPPWSRSRAFRRLEWLALAPHSRARGRGARRSRT